MRKKEVASTVKWTEKNKIYMQRLGFLDARTGKVRREMNMSGFINECVTIMCESGKHPKTDMAGSDELRAGWIKYCVAQKNKRILELQAEVVDLANKSSIYKKYNEALQTAQNL